MNVNDIQENVIGDFGEEEGMLMYKSAKEGKGKGVILEIGTWYGRSTIYLALGSKEANREKVYTIDKKIPSQFVSNIEKFGVVDWIIPIQDLSENVFKWWDKSIRLLLLDGSHDYEEVKKDFLGFEPFLVVGGMIFLHDTGNGGPKKVVEKFILNSEKFRDVRTMISHTKKAGLWGGSTTYTATYATKVKK